jgi:hypothetical protein
MLGEIVEWDVDSSWEVAGFVLQAGANIHHDHIAGARPSQHLVKTDGLCAVDITEERFGQPANLCDSRLRERSKSLVSGDDRFVRHSVHDIETVST